MGLPLASSLGAGFMIVFSTPGILIPLGGYSNLGNFACCITKVYHHDEAYSEHDGVEGLFDALFGHRATLVENTVHFLKSAHHVGPLLTHSLKKLGFF